MMLDDYYIAEAGETKGPYSKAQLRSMWDHGLITADTQYWAEGMSDWYLVETLLEPESQGSQTYPAEIRAADTTARAVSPPEEAIPKAPVSTPQSSARSDPTEAQKLDARGSPPTLKCPKCATHIDPQARVCPACQFPIWEYYENKAKAVRTEMNRIRGSNDDYLLQFYKADSFGGCMPVALILGGIASFLWVDSIVGVGLVIIGLLCLSPRVRVLFDSVGLGSRSDYKMKKGLAAVRAQNTYNPVTCPNCSSILTAPSSSTISWPSEGGEIDCPTCKRRSFRIYDALLYVPHPNVSLTGSLEEYLQFAAQHESSKDLQPDPAKNRKADAAAAAVSPKQALSKARVSTPPQTSPWGGAEMREKSGGGWIIVIIAIIMFAVVLYALRSQNTGGSFHAASPQRAASEELIKEGNTQVGFPNAILLFTKAISADPTNGHAYFARGRAKYMESSALQQGGVVGSEEEMDEALSDFNKFVQLEPSNATGYYFRGLAESMKAYRIANSGVDDVQNPNEVVNGFEHALNDYAKALELKPERAEIVKDAQKKTGKLYEDIKARIETQRTQAAAAAGTEPTPPRPTNFSDPIDVADAYIQGRVDEGSVKSATRLRARPYPVPPGTILVYYKLDYITRSGLRREGTHVVVVGRRNDGTYRVDGDRDATQWDFQ